MLRKVRQIVLGHYGLTRFLGDRLNRERVLDLAEYADLITIQLRTSENQRFELHMTLKKIVCWRILLFFLLPG